MFLHVNEAHAVTMRHAYKIKRILRIIFASVELDIMDKIVLRERPIVKATHAMEAHVLGHQPVTRVYANMANMEHPVYHVHKSIFIKINLLY